MAPYSLGLVQFYWVRCRCGFDFTWFSWVYYQPLSEWESFGRQYLITWVITYYQILSYGNILWHDISHFNIRWHGIATSPFFLDIHSHMRRRWERVGDGGGCRKCLGRCNYSVIGLWLLLKHIHTPWLEKPPWAVQLLAGMWISVNMEFQLVWHCPKRSQTMVLANQRGDLVSNINFQLFWDILPMLIVNWSRTTHDNHLNSIDNDCQWKHSTSEKYTFGIWFQFWLIWQSIICSLLRIRGRTDKYLVVRSASNVAPLPPL